MLPPLWKSEIQKAIEETANSDREQRQTEHNDAAAKIVTAINALSDAQKAQTSSEDRNEKKDRAISVATLALVFLTVVFTFLTWIVLSGQLEEMKKLYEPARQQAEAAKTAADAATKQSQNTERAIIEGQRAWVGPISAKIDGTVELGKPVKVVIGIQNTGREPGKNFRFIPEPDYATDQDSAVDQRIATTLRFCMRMPSLAYGQVIYPSSGFGTGFDFTIEFAGDKIDQSAIDGDKTLIAQGCITYDTFGATHHSGFCYFFKNKTSKPDRLNICGGGSDAD